MISGARLRNAKRSEKCSGLSGERAKALAPSVLLTPPSYYPKLLQDYPLVSPAAAAQVSNCPEN